MLKIRTPPAGVADVTTAVDRTGELSDAHDAGGEVTGACRAGGDQATGLMRRMRTYGRRSTKDTIDQRTLIGQRSP